MVSLDTVRKISLTFPEAVEMPHFEKTSFRIKKKIFATLDAKNKRCVVKLSPFDQSTFCSYDESIIYAIKGTWGKQGWTIIELKKVPKKITRGFAHYFLLRSSPGKACQAAPALTVFQSTRGRTG